MLCELLLGKEIKEKCKAVLVCLEAFLWKKEIYLKQ